ncbi:class I SAM-dependent methyltransferase [Phyllobacterium sp. LjRoot231]|uniref:class I SAM-dependent methyltransferase n=1 Tax=Phyllobacterium sp. LjRoot231 TaxID=3342289 RepID=UPI003ECCF55B
MAEWEINEEEREYINRQQGTRCDNCGSNVRSMALATSITDHWSFDGPFEAFAKKFSKLEILEINEASDLTKWLAKMPNRSLAAYPSIDMQNMPYRDGSFDLVVHSDTLEHIENPIKALRECKRVLRPGGLLAFTIPVIVGRMSRSRKGMKKSYHGFPDTGSDDYLVHTEYGADMWQQVIAAGFESVKIHTFDYPAGIAISASEIAPALTSSLPTRIWKALRPRS